MAIMLKVDDLSSIPRIETKLKTPKANIVNEIPIFDALAFFATSA